jgi:hypothetical protein
MHKNEVLKRYVTDEMSKFKNLGDLKDFVKTLETEQIYQLCQWLSSWRGNILYDFIPKGPNNWSVKNVHISNIEITSVKDEIDPLFEKHNCLLEKISQDKEIWNHNEFRSQGNINSKQFIAIKEGDKFKVVDGIHRAIRLACDGTKEFKLIYFEDGG